MADKMTEPKSLLKKRVEHKISEFNFNLTRMALRKEELQYELAVLAENEKATKEAVKSQEQQLKDFEL